MDRGRDRRREEIERGIRKKGGREREKAKSFHTWVPIPLITQAHGFTYHNAVGI